MNAKSSSIRSVIDRILDVIQDTCDLEAQIQVSGSKLVLSADLNRAVSRSPRSHPAAQGELPSEDQVFEAIKDLKGKATLTRLAKMFGIKPRQLIKPILNRLLKAKTIRKAGLAYRIDDGPVKRGRPKRSKEGDDVTSGKKSTRVARKAVTARKPARANVEAKPDAPNKRKPVKARPWKPRLTGRTKDRSPAVEKETSDTDHQEEETPESADAPDTGEERAVTAEEAPAPAMN